MILQPIVENAIRHGLEEKEGEKKILLDASPGDDCVIVRVSDNGLGMSQEKIREILRKTDVEDASSENPAEPGQNPLSQTSTEGGIGLRNVIERLRMYYGTEDILSIESGAKGTTVTLRLPEKRNDDQDPSGR